MEIDHRDMVEMIAFLRLISRDLAEIKKMLSAKAAPPPSKLDDPACPF